MAAARPIYRVGERVDGLYDENTDDMWYPGRIRCAHLGGAEADSAEDPTFEVVYDDGEVEMHVRPEFLRQHVPGTICVGTRVLCRYDGGEEYYPGQVSDVQENGRYTIAYDDGEVEEDVPLDHILEPEEEKEEGAPGTEGEDEDEEEEASNQPTNEAAAEQEQQQQEEDEDEDAEMEEAKDSLGNLADGATSGADVAHDSEESVNKDVESDEAAISEPLEHFDQPRPEHSQYKVAFRPTRQNEDVSDPTPAGVSAERAYIIESLQLLEKRLGDASSTKSVLSTLVKQMRAYPQVTADLVHERGGERLVIDALKFHQSHAVIQCYGFVLLRRLCFLCVKSTHYLLRNGIVELVIQAMNAFAEDAILQASACGALAVFTRVHSGLNILIEYQVAQLVLSTLIYHKTYSVHTRQVHYYACEGNMPVLLELCELDDLQTLNMLCGEQEEEFTGDMSPISLFLFLLRQGLSLDDKKACCAVGSLLMCLAASGKRAAALILGFNGIAELSTVMARYPTEPSIQKYSAAASKQIALCSVRQSPTKRIKDTATEILREAESLENTPTDRLPTKKSSLRGRSTSIGKRKSNPTSSYGGPSYPRGAAHTSSTPYRNAQGYSKTSSLYGQGTSGFGGDMSTFGYPGRDFPGAATAPQQPSSLVILDGSLGADSGFGSMNKRKQQLSKEDRQSELFDAYGIQGVPNSTNERPYGTKRAQLRAHLASAESTWAPPQQHAPSTSKPYSSRSQYLDHSSDYSHRDFMSRQNRWDENDEPQHDPELRQPRGAKRKKKNPAPRTAFQVKIENENQLRVSRDTRSPYPSPQRLGAATKRAAKARQKRITAGGHSAITGRSNNASSESLNDYATQLFQDNVSRGIGIPTSSKLTPREKEEIRERERLSFAEKLHKMIDKAKSTLANGNTTSVSAVNHSARQQKSSASSKTARKLRESSTTPSDDKRPLSKRPRPVINSTPKNVAKEAPSPRESTETRPAKPTSGTSKRQATPNEGHQTPSGHQASVVARTKPIAPRPIVPPKTTAEQKPRSVVKSNKVPATKFADKSEAERAKESVTAAASAEVVPASTPATDEPIQVDSDAVAEVGSPEISDAVHVQIDTAPTQQIEPTNPSSNEAATIEVESMLSNLPTELTEVVDPAGHEDKSPGETNVPREDIVAEVAVVAPTPSETEIATSPVDAPLPPQEETIPDAATDKAETELSDTSVNAPHIRVSPSEASSTVTEATEGQAIGGSATVDTLYGDAYSEFDDNGGDDEDMAAEGGVDADDPQIPVAETSDSPREVPLQESKSGEALYDDGYDEFDEDDTANAEDGEVAPAGIDSDLAAEVADVTSSEPLSGDSDQAATVIEIEGSDTPPLAPDNASTEGSRAGDESALPGGNVENNTEDGGDGGDMVNEPEELQEPRTEMADVANAANESPSDPDVLVYTTAEEQNGSASPELENNLVPDSSGESNAEGEQEPVTTAVEVDTADIHDTSDGVVEAENPGNVDEHAVVLDSEASTSTSVAELTVTEIEIVDTEPNFHSDAASGEAPATDVPGEPTDLVDHASEDILGCAVQLQQEEGESTEVTGTEAKVLLADNSASSLERDDEESKKLSADSSVVSIQSAAYDEENFDAEESHHEEEPSEAVNETNSIASPVEKVAEIAGELVDPEQEQGGENPSVSEIEVDAGTAQDVTFDADKDSEDGPNGLTTNSSELSVQSAAYEDDDFDDGAHEETGVAESEGQTLDQQPNVEEDTEVGETNVLAEAVISVDETPTAFGGDEEGPNTLDNEFPSEHSVVSGGEDFGNVALSELPKKNTTETSDTKMTGETSELQQVEHGNSTGASDSDVVEAPAVENDTPAAVHQDEAADEQQAADELDKYDDHPQMDILGEITAENATKSEDLTSECPIEEAKLPPDAVDSATVPSATNDTLASKSPEITIPADELTQEEAFDTSDTNEQPATYGDDDFDNGGEDEEVSPSVVTQDFDPVKGGEDPKDDDRDVHQASEQVSDEAGDLRSTEANAIDEPMVDPSEPESQTGDQQEQPDIETELVPVADDELAPGGIAGGLVLEAKSELDPAVSSGEVGDRVADDDSANLNSSNDEANRIAMEVAPPELGIDSSAEPDLQPAAPNEQVEEEERFQNEHEEAAEPEGAADFSTEEVPQPELESTNLAEPNEVDVTVESSANESEPSVEVATEDIVAEQAPEYTQGSDEFDEESPKSDPAPADTAAMVDNSAKLSEAAAHEEDQYGDANFDEVENDTAALKGVAPESALGQVDPGETEEIASADVANTALGVYDEHEEPKIFANVEPDISCRINDALEPSEATAGMTGDQEVAVNDQFTGDTTPEATGNADDYLNDDTIMIPDANTQDGLPVSSPDAAACEENLLSDTLPGANEDVSIATSAYVEEVVDNDDKFAVGSNSSRIGSVANDIPVATADVSPESSADVDTVPISPPKDEGYGEGFDEANPPAANSSDPVDPTPSTEDTVANTDVSVPKNNVPLETPDDTVVAESDQLNEDEDVCDEDVPNAAKNFAQAEEEEKPEDCDTISSVNVEPIEGAVESDVVAPEASGVEATIPADSEMGSVEMVEPATAAESTDVETMSVEPDVAELAVVESDSAHEFIQFEAAESEAVEPEVMAVEEPQAVQTEAVVTTVPEAAEPEAVVGEEPEAVELEVVVAEEAEAVEPEAAQAVAAAEPEAAETVNSELAAVSGGELEAMEDVVVDAETAEVAAADPSVNESASVEEKEPAIEATESEAAPQDRRQSDDVESSPTADSTPASEFPLENTSAESPPGETTIPDAIKDKLSPEASETAVAADPVIGDSDNLSVNDEGGAVEARNDPTSIGENEDASESKDDGCGEANSGKVKPDVPQIEEYADNSASAVPVGEDSPEVIATEVPGHVERDISVPGHVEHDVGVEADAPTSDTSPAIQENADPPESIYTDDVDANDDQGALDVVQNTGEVAANATSEEEEPVTEVANPEPAEVPGEAQPVAEEQTPVQADDYDADPPVDEPPASPLVETTPADAIQAEAVEEEAPSTQNFAAEAQPDASADVDVRESPEKLAVEVIESQPDELAVESSAVAASEGPATEDQYDDEDGYNDFDDQENDAPTPSVEIPAPSAAVTEAPATEDDYEEFENEDYGDEEKPAAEMSARREPPPSAREEEIEEVADEADEAEEEAYADDPDDYNNEFEDDDAPAAAPNASSPKKDQPTAAADASADEYEDDAEDEYAEDEVEESSPKAAAPRQPAAKSNSDDEMEEELGSDYAESDG
ncbi:hypothetical protein ON010_g5097 [Phytophthora cinnamomi]|nr:hypothetical protein ON010_g5097 [Phytophthora cinnamomi]